MGNIDAGDALADRFELGDLVGSGGMADVRRARDLLLDRPVAVKVLRDTVDETERDRFMTEARTLAQLSHAGLVTVLDAGTSDGQPYLVMELVEGRTLGAALREGPLPGPEVARIGAQVAAALGYAHDQGVVHRDVKPGNVLIGQDGQVKLADFGIARLIGDTVRHTATGMTIGTPAYLSPEQVRAEPVGPPSDVYSLGLVLLEALTGERTFRGSPTEAAVARLHGPPPVPEDLPPAWRDLFLAMTAPDPAARPTATDAAGVLRGLAELGMDDDAAATRVVRARVAPAPPEPRTPAAGPPPVVPPGRAEEAAIRTAQRRTAARRSPATATVAMVAVGCLLLVLAVVGVLLSRSGGGSSDEIPAQTPSRLREPLQDLHDAVHGEGP